MIRSATLRDIPQLQALFRIAFHKESLYSWWQWKYFHPQQEALSLVWEEDGEILGHYGGQFFPFHLRLQTLQVAGVTDIMTHPKVRNRWGRKAPLFQLGTTFAEEAKKRKIAFLFGFPGETSRKYGERFLSYQTLFPIQYWTLPMDLPGKPSGKLTWGEQPSHFSRYPGVCRDENWFRWRFIHRPDKHYQVATFRKAYGVLDKKDPWGILLELGGKASQWDDLLIALSRELFMEGMKGFKGFYTPGLARVWKSKLPLKIEPADFFFCIRAFHKIPAGYIKSHGVIQWSDYDVE